MNAWSCLHSTMRLSCERWHSTYEIQRQAAWPNYTPAEVRSSNCLWDSTRFLLHHYRGDFVGRVSSVGIAIRYGLDGPGVESRWRRDFLNPSRPALRSTQPTIQWVLGLIPGVKRPGRGVAHPPPYSADVKGVDLHLCSPSGPSG